MEDKVLYYKVYEEKSGLIVAVCDKELCGKTLKGEQGDFFVNPRFYKEEEGSIDDVVEILKKAVNVNLIGENAVEAGVRAGLVDSKNVVKIAGVPHAHAIVMESI